MKVIQFIKLNSYFNKIAFTSVVTLCLLIALIFVPLNTNEDNTEAATGTAQESIMTLAMMSSTASVDLAVNSTSGTFAKSTSGSEAAFSVTTNNFTGYTLSISASDDDGTLVNGSDSLATISSSLSESQFDNAAYNGKWGWRPSKLNSSTNTDFLKSPTTEAVTLDTTSAANSTANNYTIALGARADYTKPAGTYTKTFVLTAVANKINYSVTYNKNTTDTVTNMPYSDTGNTQSGDTSSTTITLSDLVPVRDGYNFKGWCSTTTSDDTCSGTIYNPDGASTDLTYGIDQTTINVGTLYAMWEVAAIPMQNLDYSLCTTEGIQVKDTRDGEIYLAKRLADGNCWMVENLNLTGGTALSADDTDVESSYISSFTTDGGLTKTGNTIVLPVSSTSGFNTNNYSYVFNSGKKTSTCTSPGCYSYYSWDAATLGSGRSITADYTDAPYSICPKGWKLPTTRYSTDSTSDFRALMIGYGGSNTIASYTSSTNPTGATMYGKIGPGTTPNFLLAGFYYNGSFSSGGSFGNYWSATSGGSTYARELFFYSSSVYSAEPSYRHYGYSVRCLLDVQFLQDQTTTTLAADLPNVGDTKTYYDKRDDEPYLVGHLADGKYWLLDNLRLDLTNSTIRNALTASNTNATETSLISLRSGNRNAGAQYASSGFATWNSSSPDNVYNQAKANTDYKDTTTTSYGSGSGKIGVYYNYCAASAGSYCYDSGAGTGNTSQDICPAGWRMPTGGSSGEYQALYNKYNTTQDATDIASLQYNLSTPLSGSFNGGSARNQGSVGYFWSSTRGNGSDMWFLYVGSSNVGPRDLNDRSLGVSVRCLLGSNFLQDQTTDTLAADLPNVGDTKTYYDKRDGEGYLVGHLADGKYWLLDNLRLDLTNSTILNAVTADNTNADAASITSLKSGNRSAGAQYAASGFAAWTQGGPPSFSNGAANVDYKDTPASKTYGSGSGIIGVYYNYCAASAGSYCYDPGAGTVDATQDICPKGWRMPTGGSSGEYNTLYGKYNTTQTAADTASLQYNLSTPLSGYFVLGSAYGQGSTGDFWSSTRSGDNDMYLLRVNLSSVGLSDSFSRSSGRSVRCLLQ